MINRDADREYELVRARVKYWRYNTGVFSHITRV